MENNTFKVDLKGIIELLSEHIYSNPGVFVRELLQNGVDAIRAKEIEEPDFQGKMVIELIPSYPQKIKFFDNGIGLSKEEIYQFLSIIGQSSKRNNIHASDFIGKFGIGLLSCFVISHKIVLETHSKKDKPYRWEAFEDGSFTITPIEEKMAYGTTVTLFAKSGYAQYYSEDILKPLIEKYGEALPYPIEFIHKASEVIINEEIPAWINPEATLNERIEYGKKAFKQSYLDAFYIDIPEIELQGTAYITKQTFQSFFKNKSRIYVKNMFVSDDMDGLVPDWAFFLKCVFNINSLSLTASREDFVEDSVYQITKDFISLRIKERLKFLRQNHPEVFEKILDVHYQSIKMISAEDDEMLELFLDYIIFETNKGRKNLKWIKDSYEKIYFSTSNEEYRKIKRIASTKDILIINAIYSFEYDFIQRLKKNYPNISIEEISFHEIMDEVSGETADDVPYNEEIIEKSNAILEPYFCKVDIKRFFPADTPVLFVADEESANAHKHQNQAETDKNPFASILKKDESPKPTLYLNANNELVLKLFNNYTSDAFEPFLKILYIQSLLLGQYPVGRKEMETLNFSLLKLSNHTLK